MAPAPRPAEISSNISRAFTIPIACIRPWAISAQPSLSVWRPNPVHFFGGRSEPLFLPVPCGLPYAAQRLGHALPALGPVRALLVRVSLGPCPWLHRLRNRQPSFVRRFHSYYGRV